MCGELPPRAGAVDPRGLVERPLDVLQAGEQQQRHERRRLPHVGEDDRNPCGHRIREPDRRFAISRCRRARHSSSPAGVSNMKRHTSAATTVGIAHGSSMAVRTRPRAASVRSSASASARPSTSSSVTVAAAKASVCPIAPQNRAIDERLDVVAAPDEGRPSHGMRRSCRCSDSQTVQRRGTSAISRDDAERRQARIVPAEACSSVSAIMRASGYRARLRCEQRAHGGSRPDCNAARGSCWRVSARCRCDLQNLGQLGVDRRRGARRRRAR